MQIVELTAHAIQLPLKRTIKHASHTRTATENVVVVCKLDDGTIGLGEGVPRDYVTGETIDSVMAVLKRADWQVCFRDQPKAFVDAVTWIRNIKLPSAVDDARQCKTNAARCAIELALLDAAGQHFGLPLSEVAKIVTPELFSPRDKVQYSGAITSSQGTKAKLAGLAMRLYGFSQIKIKVGIEGQNDALRVKNIRKVVGSKMDLRVDANEAWPAAEVLERVQALAPFQISSVEQPVRHEHVHMLVDVCKQTAIPIMLDESLCSMFDAEQALAGRYCSLFNIRLSKCGGLIRSLELADFARRHGLGYQLGCQVGESAILSAAGRHFATSARDIRYLEGSYDRRLLKENLARPDLTFGWGGWAPALTQPGLGIRLMPDALERMTLSKEVLYVRR